MTLQGLGRKAQTQGYMGYRHAGPQCRDRALNRRIEVRPEMIEEHLFEDAKLRRRCMRVQQSLAQQRSVAAPNILESDYLVGNLGHRHREKAGGSAVSKLDGSEPTLRSRIDDHRFRVRPGNDST